jgi:hypothetical protein
MKELRAVVSDEEFATLEHLAQDLGVSLEELVRRSLACPSRNYIASQQSQFSLFPSTE